MTRRAWLSAIILFSSLGGCSVLPVDRYTRSNQPLCNVDSVRLRNNSNREFCSAYNNNDETFQPPAPVPATAEIIEEGDLPGPEGGKSFVGVAISGGGSRAANFSLAALIELGRAGLLDNVAAISSVSGGSVTAAYYGLYSRDHFWKTADPDTEDRVKTHFREDLQNKLEGGIVSLLNIPRYWLSDYDRSDTMKRVLDDYLGIAPDSSETPRGRDGRWIAFGQLPRLDCNASAACTLPRLYLNATTMDGRTFVFSEDALSDLGSRIDNFPLADAVIASAAFPGGFQKVTLERYRDVLETTKAPQKNISRGCDTTDKLTGTRANDCPRGKDNNTKDDLGYYAELETPPPGKPRQTGASWLLDPAPLESDHWRTDSYSPLLADNRLYIHLMDGGASDNLGVQTLIRTLQSSNAPIANCAFIVIDSYQDPVNVRWEDRKNALGIDKGDTRSGLSYLISDSLLTSFDTLLTANRENMLRELDYPRERVGQQSYWVAKPLLHRKLARESNRNLSCKIWHLSFQRLRYLTNTCGTDLDRMKRERLANETTTAFRLDSSETHDPIKLQENLFDIAKCLIHHDTETYPRKSEEVPSCNNEDNEQPNAPPRSVLASLRTCYKQWGLSDSKMGHGIQAAHP